MLHQFLPRVFSDYEQLAVAAAHLIEEKMITKLSGNGVFVLGCATGSTPEGMYKELISRLAKQTVDLSRLYTVNLDEYFPIHSTDPQSYYQYMRQHVWQPLKDVHPEFDYTSQAFIPDGTTTDPVAECQAYEERIRAIGGIDVQVVGIGTNGHIGFNEPGTAATSRTRVVSLAPETRAANSRFFGSEDQVPHQAITMGIATILAAKEILVMASGNTKSPIIQALHVLEEPTDAIPASWLLTHPQVSFLVDAAAVAP